MAQRFEHSFWARRASSLRRALEGPAWAAQLAGPPPLALARSVGSGYAEASGSVAPAPEERGIGYANEAAEVAATFLFLGCFMYPRESVTAPRKYLAHYNEEVDSKYFRFGATLAYEDVYVGGGGDFETV